MDTEEKLKAAVKALKDIIERIEYEGQIGAFHLRPPAKFRAIDHAMRAVLKLAEDGLAWAT